MTERDDGEVVDEQDLDEEDDGEAVDEQGLDEEDTGEEDNGEPSPVNSMREMIEYIARALASNPDAVSVTEEDDGDRIYLRLSVDDQDKGKVIGRGGRVAESIRSLLRVAAVKARTRVILQID